MVLRTLYLTTRTLNMTQIWPIPNQILDDDGSIWPPGHGYIRVPPDTGYIRVPPDTGYYQGLQATGYYQGLQEPYTGP